MTGLLFWGQGARKTRPNDYTLLNRIGKGLLLRALRVPSSAILAFLVHSHSERKFFGSFFQKRTALLFVKRSKNFRKL
jgi:hypothetical protein